MAKIVLDETDEPVKVLTRNRRTGMDAGLVDVKPGEEVDFEVTDSDDVVIMVGVANGHTAATGNIGKPGKSGTAATAKAPEGNSSNDGAK